MHHTKWKWKSERRNNRPQKGWANKHTAITGETLGAPILYAYDEMKMLSKC